MPNLFSQDYNILEFGAVNDGKTMNTESIQNAIDAAYNAGGGKVIIPAGIYLTGSIVLKSNIELHLLENAVLFGSTLPQHYKSIKRWKALILADSASNIAIKGKGIIDGQGAKLALHIDSLFYAGKIDSSEYNFIDKRPKAHIRPQIIEFVNSNQIEIKGITLQNSASWVQSYFRCQNLVIDSIRVESDTYWNNDGIDVIDSKNVRIVNSYINSSDDGICLKSYALGYKGDQDMSILCDSIYIANCVIRSSASALKFGTSSYRGFKNITIENIKIFDTFRSAIALESVHNGPIENVLIQNIKAENTGNALFIRLGGKPNNERKGYFKNVTIKNIEVQISAGIPDEAYTIRGPALPFFHNTFPSSITGIPNNRISNVSLENIMIIYPGGGNNAYANLPLNRLKDIPENEEMYPEFSMFGELPAWGFYLRHAEAIHFNGVFLKIQEPDYRPAIVLDDTENIQFKNIDVEGDSKNTQIFKNKVGAIPID